MSLGHIVVQLHDEDGLADTRGAKEANLAALAEGDIQVNHLQVTRISCSRNMLANLGTLAWILMGMLLSSTPLPLTSPLVPSMAKVLTLFSLRGWANSKMSFVSTRVRVRALRIS